MCKGTEIFPNNLNVGLFYRIDETQPVFTVGLHLFNFCRDAPWRVFAN